MKPIECFENNILKYTGFFYKPAKTILLCHISFYISLRFTGGDWVTLSYGSPGSWSIGTVVYLAKRNDTNLPNTSPVTTGKPTYRF